VAIPADTVWEVQSTGNDANGGGFSTANKGATGADMTLGAPTVFTSTLSATATTTLTDSAAGFLNTMLGNVIQISGQGFYCITAFTNTSTVTVDRTLGTFSTTSGRVGGPVASPGVIGATTTVVAGNTVYIKATGTYTMNSASSNIAGGVVNNGTASRWVGYTSNRTQTNSDSPPYIVASGISTFVMFTLSNGVLWNVSLDGAGLTSSRGLATGQSLLCKFANMTNGATTAWAIACEATGCSTQPVFQGPCNFCVAHGNSSNSFSTANQQLFGCVAYGNTSGGFNTSGIVANCVAYGNTGGTSDGFANSSGSTPVVFINCISESNGRYGFNRTGTAAPISGLTNCSAKNNSTAATNGTWVTINLLNPSGTVFVDPANQDFRLNNTAGAGALLRAAGWPTTWPAVNASMLSYLDIGAAQHQDAGGSVIVIED
jgi:hypothetical protein